MSRNFGSLARKRSTEFFHSEFIEDIGDFEVAWIDLMGVRDALRSGQEKPSIWRGELLAVTHRYGDVDSIEEVFTVGDGVVILSHSKDYLKEFLAALFTHYMRVNIQKYEDEPWLARLLRAGIGSGPVQKIDMDGYEEGNDYGNPIPDDFANKPFGPGIITAMDAERGAPMGVFENNTGTISPYEWWREHQYPYQNRDAFIQMFEGYQQWYSDREEYSYNPEETDHLQQAREFFKVPDFDISSPSE